MLTLTDTQGAPTTYSARVLRYVAPRTDVPGLEGQLVGELYIEAFDELPVGVALFPQTQFIVNGRAFNGAGRANMTIASGEVDGPAIGFLLGRPQDVAMLNSMFPTTPVESALFPFRNNEFVRVDTGFAATDGDESWDAADYQNVLAGSPSDTHPADGWHPDSFGSDDPVASSTVPDQLSVTPDGR